MDPQTPDEWLQVAKSRLEEARAIHENDAQAVGSAYLAGYGVEGALKSYAMKHNGSLWGHDLVNLVTQSGMRLGEFKNGEWLLSQWAVDWRYLRENSQLPREPGSCVEAAGQLQGYILKRLSRQEKRRHKRGKPA